MAVHWSWAFGQETATQLQTDMDFTVVASSNVTNTITYTYAGSPGRWSLGLSTYEHITLPPSAFTPTGWITMAAYLDATAVTTYVYPIRAFGGVNYIGCYNVNSTTVQFYVNNVAKETFAPLTHHDWHYWALQYDVSGTTWSGQLFIDGVAKTAAHTQAGAVASTEGKYMLAGDGAAGTHVNKVAQAIVYSALGDAGETPLFVTRLPPNAANVADTVGTWAAFGAGTTLLATNTDPLDTAKYAQEATPTSGDAISTEVNNLIAQLGITPGLVLAATNHTYSSGVNVNVFASVGLSGVYVDGATITPDSADTTYGFGTKAGGLSSGSTIQCKYEVV